MAIDCAFEHGHRFVLENPYQKIMAVMITHNHTAIREDIHKREI